MSVYFNVLRESVPAEKLMDKPLYSYGTTMVKPCFVTMF